MQTIKITITSEKPTSVVLTEQKPEGKKAKKKATGKNLDALLDLIPEEAAIAGTKDGDEQPCD